MARQAAERARLIERLKRARELLLAGDIDREHYAQEQRDCKTRIADLMDVSGSSIQAAAQLFELTDEEWASLPRLKQKSLAQLALARATLAGNRLKAIQPSKAAYPLIRLALEAEPAARCHSGSDGIRTRGLRLDRPTC